MKTNGCLACTVHKTSEDMMRNMKNLCLMFVITGLLVIGFLSVSHSAVLSKEDFSLYGFVDTSYTQNFKNPSNKVNQNRIFDVGRSLMAL